MLAIQMIEVTKNLFLQRLFILMTLMFKIDSTKTLLLALWNQIYRPTESIGKLD